MKSIFLFLIISLASLTPPLHAQNITRPNIPGPGGLSANAFTGNLFYQRTDVFIPGRGLSLAVTFSYNSTQLGQQRGVGNGWRLNYDMSYQLLPDQSISVERMDGRQDAFTLSGTDYIAPAGIFDTLTQYEPGKFKLTAKDGMAYFFEDASHKKLTKIEDRNGNMLTLAYIAGKLATATDATGRSIAFGWTGDLLTSITDPNFSPQRTYQYAYDSFGNLTQYTDPLGEKINYDYNPNRQLISMTDRNGNSTVVAYTNSGAVRRMSSCDSRLELTYNRARRQTYVVEQTGNNAQLTTYTFDAEENLENQEGNCCGFNVTYGYDADKNITQRTDANGVTYNYTYDGLGNLLTNANADGTMTYAYDPVYNQITSIEDRRSNTTTFTYDATGNLTQIDRPLGVTEQFSFNADGTMASSTDGNDNTTQYTYDANGYLTDIDYPIGAEIYAYDATGNLTSVTDANSHTTTFTYDALNRPTSVADHLGNTRTFTYDANGNLTGENDENSHLTEYGYDVLNRLNEVVTPVATYRYNYDQLGNLTRMLDGNQHATHYSYNSQNLLVTLTDAVGNSTHYEYDGNGNLLSRTDANGNTTAYLYDDLNRLVEKSYNGNTDSYSYDANGNLTSCSNDDITINFTYDALNRLASKTYVEWGKTISYTYDDAGNRTSMTDPDGGLTTYTYDDLNRLVSIENPSQLLTTFQYDDAGRLTQQTNGNGTRTEYAYDDADRVLSIIHRKSDNSVLRSFEYTYDSTGNRLSMRDENNGLNLYTYDDANRLAAVTYADGQTESFAYDPAGNRTQLTRNGNPTSYAYDSADRLQTAGNVNYAFDANGNLVSKTDTSGTTTYSYDGEDRLVQVELPNGAVVDFGYDPFGNRILRDVDGTVTKFVLDGVNNLLELDNSDATLARYTAAFGYDTWLSMERGGNEYVYHNDALGSVYGLSNASEGLENSYDYFAFGRIKGQSGSVSNSVAFTGREWDSQVGLYYYRSRYLDGATGRFVSKDKFPGIQNRTASLNYFSYAEGNPIVNTDPRGEAIPLLAIGISAAINAVIDVGAQLAGGTSIECLDYASVGFNALLGVLPYDKLAKLAKKVAPPIVGESLSKLFNIAGGGLLRGISTGTIRSIGKAIDNHTFSKTGLVAFRDASVVRRNFHLRRVRHDIEFHLLNSVFPYSAPNLLNNLMKERRPFCDDGEKGNQDGSQENGEGLFQFAVGLRAFDPNKIEGPEGIGPNRWVSRNDLFKYTIYFENDPDSATAAAQLVTITQDLDPKLDPSTFRLDNFGFGSFQFEVPVNSTHYQARLDVADSVGVLVDVEAGIDYDDHRLYWTFESIDTVTGLFTTDPLAGFLPVNDTLTGSGEGFVSYTISARESAMTYDSILAQASIVFDDNAPLATNQEVNLVDADAPESEVLNIQSAIDSAHLLVEFTGTDVGSGLQHYNLYVRQGNGSFLKWMGPIAGPYAILPATPDSTYCVISISADSVLNLENLPQDCNPVTFTLDLLNGCPNTLDWTFGQAPIQPGTYRAVGSILSSSQVAETGSVHFRAGQEVNLSQGFEAVPGSVFSAKIEACDPPMGANIGLPSEPGAATTGESRPLRLDPGTGRVRVRFHLPQAGAGSLRIVNAIGAEVAQPVPHQVFAAGEHQYIVDVSGFPAGGYSLVLQVGEERAVWRVEVER